MKLPPEDGPLHSPPFHYRESLVITPTLPSVWVLIGYESMNRQKEKERSKTDFGKDYRREDLPPTVYVP